MNPQYRPYVKRFVIVLLVSFLGALVFNEVTYLLQKDKNDRAPRTITLVIPAGTAARIADGEAEPSIPETMSFVIGDTLLVKNEDSAPHQLGPVWVPAGSTGSLVLKDANHYSYSCSFTPSRYLGLDVGLGTDITTRIAALAVSGPTLAGLFFLYSLLVFPVKPSRDKLESKA
jgi:hypothetical protein